MGTVDRAARLRGTATGLLSAALAVAAHSVGSGAAPSGAVVAQLAVLAATIGALAATIGRAADARVLLGLLASGQVCGHVILSAVGHTHAQTSAPAAAVMVAAHTMAVVTGAVLIAASDRLFRAVSRVLRAAVRIAAAPICASPVVAIGEPDQPLRSALLLAASVSHRGPPVNG